MSTDGKSTGKSKGSKDRVDEADIDEFVAKDGRLDTHELETIPTVVPREGDGYRPPRSGSGGEGLGRKGTADHVTGVNLTPMKDLLTAVQAANIPIWVCGACAVARQIGAGDLVAGAVIKGMADYIKAVAERDRNVAF